MILTLIFIEEIIKVELRGAEPVIVTSSIRLTAAEHLRLLNLHYLHLRHYIFLFHILLFFLSTEYWRMGSFFSFNSLAP